MITKFRKREPAARPADRPRTYFVHIPKTAGITLKTYLENNYLASEIATHHGDARALPASDLNDYALWTGHFASEALQMLTPRPEAVLLLVREPMSRLRSWAAHGRRSQYAEYRAYLEGRTDAEAVVGEAGYDAFQAHWLARALRDGAESKRIPEAHELPGLLKEIDLVGVTEHLDRFIQLVAYRMSWAPPPNGWHINQRPDGIQTSGAVETAEDQELRQLLAVDFELYERAERRFWTEYAEMLNAISGGPRFTADSARDVSFDTVQQWLRSLTVARQMAKVSAPVSRVDSSADEPFMGEGWWWRECPKDVAYRWTGPGSRTTLWLAPLETDRDYAVTIDAMGAADWTTWEHFGLEVNGCRITAVHEHFRPAGSAGTRLRFHATVPAAVVASQHGHTEIAFTVPESRSIPGRSLVVESQDTVRHDERRVGIAVHRVRIEPAVVEVKPSIGLRRAS